MDVRRIILIVGLAIVSYIMILQWSNDYSATAEQSTNQSVVIPTEGSSFNDIPTATSSIPTDQAVSTENSTQGDVVSVITDTLNININLTGGDIELAALPQYPNALSTPNIPFKILETEDRYYVAQSGLVGDHGIDTGNRARYQSAEAVYRMADGQDELNVVLSHTAENGLTVNKVFTLNRSSYVIHIRHEITNNAAETRYTTLFAQIKRDSSEDPTQAGIGKKSYLGATFSTDGSAYEKVSFKDLDDEDFSARSANGWLAMQQHYFLSAWVPATQGENSYYALKSNGLYYAGYKSSSFAIAPGETVSLSGEFYVGPKKQSVLADLASNLEKTVDYGWLWWIAQPLFKLLDFIHSLVGNWGWAIVLMTLTVKTILYPLTASSYRSMAKMRKFTPKIQQLKDQFGDDRQRMSQEMMKLYQKEKLNPLGGCLPMILQMPIFIALYWTLMESVELRQSPFMFWIVDLSVKDPFFVLPLLMGVSMFIQMQMQQQPTMDPMQAKIMKLMPVMFTFMFLWFPAGLTLYWLSNNIITIVQQFIVNKSIERAEAKKSAD
ncbi:membrane protein insertase YidC [Reinekea thalattae]|uniref:Membrane protein insertase YidC n=1 Tax=Reinekea thalattae TaxID=2593301 RepID=A0A5C8Z9T7_9GAMM|nr:membrane protein insertase YidC [Reinekea thalattae]TXR54722.1 membrane protein insertase YidC [Reinekea thalattae]